MTICDYSGIAKYYDLWSMGDDAYAPVAKFYLSFLESYSGVFAELGVGTGRIAIPLSRRPNVSVYGIDSCREMIEQCYRNKLSDSKLDLICTDFINFSLPHRADIVYMPFRTIGHILNCESLEAFFINVRLNLNDNGLFIFDHYMFSKAWAFDHNNVDIVMHQSDGILITDRYLYDFDNKTMHCIVKYNDITAATFDFRWIDTDEIYEMYPRHGFSLKALYGDFDGSDWISQSPNQIWVLRRES